MATMSEPPAFTTERLRVWIVVGRPNGDCHDRTMFIATVTDQDWPGVAVSCSVWSGFQNWIDWIQVADAMRGNGYGEELMSGIEKHIGGSLTWTATTESSERLAERLEAKYGNDE